MSTCGNISQDFFYGIVSHNNNIDISIPHTVRSTRLNVYRGAWKKKKIYNGSVCYWAAGVLVRLALDGVGDAGIGFLQSCSSFPNSSQFSPNSTTRHQGLFLHALYVTFSWHIYNVFIIWQWSWEVTTLYWCGNEGMFITETFLHMPSGLQGAMFPPPQNGSVLWVRMFSVFRFGVSKNSHIFTGLAAPPGTLRIRLCSDNNALTPFLLRWNVPYY